MQFAWLEAALCVGVIVGGLVLSTRGGFRYRILTTLVVLNVLGVGMATIGLTPRTALPLAIVMMFVVGFGIPITHGLLHAVVQGEVAPEMQGRVFILIGSVSVAMLPLGWIIAGPVVDAIGVQTWFIAGGIVTGLMGVVSFFFPAIVYIEDGPGEEHVVERVTSVLGSNPVEID